MRVAACLRPLRPYADEIIIAADSRVDEEDRASIGQALAEQPLQMSKAPGERVTFVSLQEMDRVWEGGAVSEGAYRASIEARQPTSSMAPFEQRHLFFAVSNEGTHRWPASLDSDPPIRLSYRWLNTDGSVHTQDGSATRR
ncbi:MAG: hypothetical protein ACLQMH_14350 [Solirubrobacteraceae bacterium]